MRIKSYFTDSVQEAIEHARVELGPDVMLMNSKKTEPELRALGGYEVVFGVASDVASASSTVLPRKAVPTNEATIGDNRRATNGSSGVNKGLAALLAVTQPAFVKASETVTQTAAANSIGFNQLPKDLASVLPAEPMEKLTQSALVENTANASATTRAGDDVSRELADLRQQIEAVKRSMLQARDRQEMPNISDDEGRAVAGAVPTFGLRSYQVISDEQAIRKQLTVGGFSDELANEIAEAVAQRKPASRDGGAGTEWREIALYAELSARFRVAPGLCSSEPTAGPASSLAGGRAILFAGPAGSGKTTSLLKLAMRHSLAARVPLQILSLDTLRVGGWEQLAAYARIAGLPFNVIHNPAGLGAALDEYRGKKLVLIDTPGISPAEWRETPELAAWVTRAMTNNAGLEVQLVLPAVLRPEIAQRAIDQFSALRPAKLLLTHLDEVDAPGVTLELAMRSGLPLSYLGNGQQIPEDLEEASEERLLGPFGAAPERLAYATTAA